MGCVCSPLGVCHGNLRLTLAAFLHHSLILDFGNLELMCWPGRLDLLVSAQPWSDRPAPRVAFMWVNWT